MKKFIPILLTTLVFSLLLIHCSDDNNPPETLKYTLTTETKPAEGGSISPASGTYTKGSEVSLKATPANGYTFKKWFGGVDTNPITLTINSDKKVVAEFEINGTAPVAGFTANKTSVKEEESISFTDQSTNDPTGWSWNFGDGNTSTLQNFTHAYSTAGTYTVSLTATNAYGTHTETKNNYITASSSGTAPIADFTSDKTTINEGETISFTDQSANSPTSWNWDFGDGETSTEQNPAHTYNTTSTYNVSLVATNTHGSDTETKNNYITVSSSSTGGETDTVTDIDGNVYQTIKIGNQWWMAENIKVTHYADGTTIPYITDNSEWGNNNEAYCYYDNNTNSQYGALYTWEAAKNAAPNGWHMPTDEEWKQLEMHLGMSRYVADGGGYRGTNEGSKLAGNKDLWNNGALDSNAAFGLSGFNSLPGGFRTGSGAFHNLGSHIYLWSATESGSPYAWYRLLNYNQSDVDRATEYKSRGLSVRYIKNN